jgi:hypothetical protein
MCRISAMTPSSVSAGTTVGEARSRRGNHRLKNAMFLAAFAALRDPASNLIGRGGVGFKGERPLTHPGVGGIAYSRNDS